jgi:hypothetical protein
VGLRSANADLEGLSVAAQAQEKPIRCPKRGPPVPALNQIAIFRLVSGWAVDFPSKAISREFTQIIFSANIDCIPSFDRHNRRAIVPFGIIDTQSRLE